jgi:hypothetical protein
MLASGFAYVGLDKVSRSGSAELTEDCRKPGRREKRVGHDNASDGCRENKTSKNSP